MWTWNNLSLLLFTRFSWTPLSLCLRSSNTFPEKTVCCRVCVLALIRLRVCTGHGQLSPAGARHRPAQDSKTERTVFLHPPHSQTCLWGKERRKARSVALGRCCHRRREEWWTSVLITVASYVFSQLIGFLYQVCHQLGMWQSPTGKKKRQTK